MLFFFRCFDYSVVYVLAWCICVYVLVSAQITLVLLLNLSILIYSAMHLVNIDENGMHLMYSHKNIIFYNLKSYLLNGMP